VRMLTHLNAAPAVPKRVVVLGAQGFVGATLVRALAAADVSVLPLGRGDVDLEAADAGDRLAALLSPEDTLVFISAKAPVKTVEMLTADIRMLEAVTAAIGKVSPAHLIYVSSDAVYGDEPVPLDEGSPAAPGSLHGVMHLARELGLKHAWSGPLGIVRPTLIFGAADPHNGYGPNRFCRLAQKGEPIVLFGEGEERRDHVFVEDVAALIVRMILMRSTGVLNAATGTVTTFRAAAELAVRLFDSASEISGSPRVGPMPHNGYRPFDAAATAKAFPDFRYTSLEDGLRRSWGLS